MKTIWFCALSLFASAATAQTPPKARVKLTLDEIHQIRALIRDVVSVGIDHDFKDGNILNRDLVRFGIYRTALHSLQSGKTFEDRKDGKARLPARYVTTSATRYFGKTVKHQSVADWKFRANGYDGYFELFEQLDFETLKNWRVDGTSRKNLEVHAEFVDSMASSESDRDVIGEVEMTLKQVASNGQKRFIITSYRHLNDSNWALANRASTIAPFHGHQWF